MPSRQRTATAVDPRVVINAEQAHRFLAAVEADGERGRHLKAFFACMYYAALRPEEATELRRSSITLPAEAGRWGEMRLTDARPRSGCRWTNTGEIRELSPLKHRADGEERRVPIHPELAEILQTHLAEFGPTASGGRLFVGANGGPVTDRTYLRVFHRARSAAFTAAEAASPLMEVPYALRHAAVSTWLRTTGDAALVARWAGHSVAVLLRVYAKTVDGAEQESLDRIWTATRRHPDSPPPGTL
jgi:integrase